MMGWRLVAADVQMHRVPSLTKMRTIKTRAPIDTVLISRVTCVSAGRHHKGQWPRICHLWMLAGPEEAKTGREKEGTSVSSVMCRATTSTGKWPLPAAHCCWLAR